MRSGVGQSLGIQGIEPGENEKNFSPVFLVWLDCVFQLISQFSEAFEFTDSLLIFIADCYYNARFGTFLLSSEKERVSNELYIKTKSVWSHVFDHRDEFANRNYVPFYKTLVPLTSVASLRFWASYFTRYNKIRLPMFEQ